MLLSPSSLSSLSSLSLSSSFSFSPLLSLYLCRIIVGAPSGTFPGGLSLGDPGAPRAERSGLVYACPVQPGTCDGIRGDTTRYLGVPHARDNNPCVDGLTLRTFPQSYIEGRLFDQARKPFYICLVIAIAIFFWHGFNLLEGGWSIRESPPKVDFSFLEFLNFYMYFENSYVLEHV